MNFKELQNFDSSLTIYNTNPTDFKISGISHSDAPQAGTFIFIKSSRFHKDIGRRCERDKFLDAGVVVEEKYFQSLSDDEKSKLASLFEWTATVQNVNHAMCTLSKPFYDKRYDGYNFQVDGRKLGTVKIDPTARIAENVFIGENVTIGENCQILPGVNIMPDVTIGNNTILFPNVTLYPLTKIGNECRIHAGTVIGSDGFGYNFFNGSHNKIWHLNGVTIADRVEIGGNTMIDCGAFIDTFIDEGTRIDNLVQLSHNVQIGKHVIVCGTTGIAGSVEISDYAAFGAGAGVAPNARIGTGAQVAARACISENAIIEPKSIMGGHPARPVKEWLRSQAVLKKLAKK
jgi:UDP-3-O-[3-hydroxymyristoyl] glucosamine N-acyltransferase